MVFVEGVALQFQVFSLNIGLSTQNENSLSLELKNPNNIYTITQDNVNGQFNITNDPQTDEYFKQKIYNYKVENNFIDPKTGTKRWNLAHKSSIFSRHDTIMVFVKLPWTPQSTNEVYGMQEVWVPRFNGYISSVTVADNYLTSGSAVTITGYCAKGILKLNRVAQNAHEELKDLQGVDFAVSGDVFADISSIQGVTTEGSTELNPFELFADIGSPTFFSNSLYNTEAYNVVSYMITGKRSDADVNVPPGRGFGNVTKRLKYRWNTSLSYVAGESDPGNISPPTALSLGEFQQHAITGFDTGFAPAANRRALSRDEMLFIGSRSNFKGQHAPHGEARTLVFIEPESGIGYRGRGHEDPKSAITDGGIEIDYTNRLEVIDTLLGMIDYQFYVSPMGDFIFEFPKYDFYPEDMDTATRSTLSLIDYSVTEPFSITETDQAAFDLTQGVGLTTDSVNLSGSMRQYYLVDHLISKSSIEERADDVKTVYKYSGGYPGLNSEAETQEIQRGQMMQGIIWLPALAMRYGVNVESIVFPEIHNDTRKLDTWAMLKIQKMLANIYQVSASDLPGNPMMLPNSPFYIRARDCHCLINTVTDTYAPSNYTTTVALNTFRHRNTPVASVQGNNFTARGGKNDYFLLTGTPSMPVTYNTILDNKYDDFFVKRASTVGNLIKVNAKLVKEVKSVLSNLPRDITKDNPFIYAPSIPASLGNQAAVSQPLAEAEKEQIEEAVEDTPYEEGAVDSIEAMKNTASANSNGFDVDYTTGIIVAVTQGILALADGGIDKLIDDLKTTLQVTGLKYLKDMTSEFLKLSVGSFEDIEFTMRDVVNFALALKNGGVADPREAYQLSSELLFNVHENNRLINTFYNQELGRPDLSDIQRTLLTTMQKAERSAATQEAIGQIMARVDIRFQPQATNQLIIDKAKAIDVRLGIEPGSLGWDNYAVAFYADLDTVEQAFSASASLTSFIPKLEQTLKQNGNVEGARRLRDFGDSYQVVKDNGSPQRAPSGGEIKDREYQNPSAPLTRVRRFAES